MVIASELIADMPREDEYEIFDKPTFEATSIFCRQFEHLRACRPESDRIDRCAVLRNSLVFHVP